MEVVQVQPRDSYLHNIYVPTNTTMKWSFTTKKNNISFGLFKRKEKGPLPNSSDLAFHAHQTSLRKQMTNANENHGEDIETNYINSPSSSRPRSKSLASVKLKEGGLDEIIPIQNYHSSTQKIEGTYAISEPGNYVLVFDNTFSRTTAKTLTYTVALGQQEDVQAPVMAGWLLKKKRKRMQGWAKRWFRLSTSGVLSYATSQQTVTRGSIQILLATISYKPNLRQIHIDSGTMIYHLKCLTDDEYTEWQTALKDIRKTSNNDLVEQNPYIQEEYIKSNASLAPPPVLSHRNSSNRLQDNFKMSNIIEQGISLSEIHQQQVSVLGMAIQEIKQALKDQNLNAIQQLVNDKLDMYTPKITSTAEELQNQWRSAQKQYLHTTHRRSGSPLSTHLDESIHQTLDVSQHRSSSVYSRLSTYSEQFYDAEDIVLSGDEEDALDHNLIIDDEESSDEEDVETHSNSTNGILELDANINCTRRATLPAPAAADAGSALSIIRKNVGKDLSTIAMPISMNEPLSLLQKACEELEYCNLLQKAASRQDPLERLMYVTTFFISTYASSQYRIGRKPFNPMMTETYESIRPDMGFRFVSEKVSHNPLVIAAHAEGKEFRYWQSTEIKSKFWGKSMEFMTEGNFHVTLTGHSDHFVFFKPSSWMKNMIAGEKYLEHSGESKVVNRTTGDYATVVFKEGTGGGLFGAPTKRNEVIATLYNAQGNKMRRIVGKWSDSLVEEINLDKSKLSVLWKAHPPGIAQHEKYFGFTKFAVELNELTELEEGKLPITDTRFRPDQLLYEKGLVEQADQEKLRIEQKQRERRKEFELAGKEWKPRWFVPEGDEWVYNGQYWPARENGQWPKDQFELW